MLWEVSRFWMFISLPLHCWFVGIGSLLHLPMLFAWWRKQNHPCKFWMKLIMHVCTFKKVPEFDVWRKSLISNLSLALHCCWIIDSIDAINIFLLFGRKMLDGISLGVEKYKWKSCEVITVLSASTYFVIFAWFIVLTKLFPLCQWHIGVFLSIDICLSDNLLF